ncbi:hypothetical protein Ancab_028757 [Ancistrocladus abbreviatus]
MGSRDEPSTLHQPLLSSLVVRPSDSGGGGGGSDYEPGEVRHDAPPYSRSDRYSEAHGYRIRAVSGSPVHRRDFDRRIFPDYDHLGGPHRHGFASTRGAIRSAGFASARGAIRSAGRNRDYSPPYSRGRAGGRPFGRAFDGPRLGTGPFKGEGMHRNNPNVRPREGDWYCPECGNLNFARREYCNNCDRFCYAPIGGPRRGHGGPPPPLGPPRRFQGPPLHRSPGRFANGYRSPPRGWLRDGPRDFGPGGPPPPRDKGRFLEHHACRDQVDYPEDDFRDQGKFDRLPLPDWTSRDRARDQFLDDRKGYERRLLSPLPPPPGLPHRGRWAEQDVRERSRSPVRGGPPPKDFHYSDRDQDDRRNGGRDRIGSVY